MWTASNWLSTEPCEPSGSWKTEHFSTNWTTVNFSRTVSHHKMLQPLWIVTFVSVQCSQQVWARLLNIGDAGLGEAGVQVQNFHSGGFHVFLPFVTTGVTNISFFPRVILTAQKSHMWHASHGLATTIEACCRIHIASPLFCLANLWYGIFMATFHCSYRECQ